jgi:hypothetical protein
VRLRAVGQLLPPTSRTRFFAQFASIQVDVNNDTFQDLVLIAGEVGEGGQIYEFDGTMHAFTFTLARHFSGMGGFLGSAFAPM